MVTHRSDGATSASAESQPVSRDQPQTGSVDAPRFFPTILEFTPIEDRIIKELEIPEWGGWYRFRALSQADRKRVQDNSRVESESGEFAVSFIESQVWLLAYSMIDQAGNRLISNDRIDSLRKKNGTVVRRVARFAGELSDMLDLIGMKPEPTPNPSSETKSEDSPSD